MGFFIYIIIVEKTKTENTWLFVYQIQDKFKNLIFHLIIFQIFVKKIKIKQCATVQLRNCTHKPIN